MIKLIYMYILMCDICGAKGIECWLFFHVFILGYLDYLNYKGARNGKCEENHPLECRPRKHTPLH